MSYWIFCRCLEKDREEMWPFPSWLFGDFSLTQGLGSMMNCDGDKAALMPKGSPAVVLDPQWLLDAMAQVVGCPRVLQLLVAKDDEVGWRPEIYEPLESWTLMIDLHAPSRTYAYVYVYSAYDTIVFDGTNVRHTVQYRYILYHIITYHICVFMYIIWLPLPLSKSYTDAHTIMWLAKSCTGWQVVYPTSCKFLYIPCGAGIQPSSVANLYAKTKPTPATLVSCGTWEKSSAAICVG